MKNVTIAVPGIDTPTAMARDVVHSLPTLAHGVGVMGPDEWVDVVGA